MPPARRALACCAHPAAAPLRSWTHQDVTGLGIIEFLLGEAARVAASGDTCFYYQRDHWRSSIDPRGVDPTALPRFPAALDPFFDDGRGGFQVLGRIPVGPRCVATARDRDPYA